MKKQADQNLPLSDAMGRYGRKLPDIYRIAVAGVVNPDWSERLGGLRIETRIGDDPKKPVTVLEGPIRDQAELSGILNTLYSLRCTLLSVKMLKK